MRRPILPWTLHLLLSRRLGAAIGGGVIIRVVATTVIGGFSITLPLLMLIVGTLTASSTSSGLHLLPLLVLPRPPRLVGISGLFFDAHVLRRVGLFRVARHVYSHLKKKEPKSKYKSRRTFSR